MLLGAQVDKNKFIPTTYCIELHHLLDTIIGNNRIRHDLLRSIELTLILPDLEILIPLCTTV